MDFSEDEIHRYSRHILLGEVGGTGQAKLRAASVLIVGAGGLGSPLALYLAAAGIGRIGIVDDDVVELSNLQRQIAHGVADLGTSKASSAAKAAQAINPDVTVDIHCTRLSPGNARNLIDGYDLVCDGSDNFPTRFLVADTCLQAKRTLISAAVLRFEGQLSTFKPHEGGPCYRCLYPEAPPDGMVPSCSEAGVLGAVTGVMGTLQATEVLKEILGIGTGLASRLLIWDAMDVRFRTINIPRDPGCPGCGHLHRAHYAFVVATGAAAIGRDVVMFATNRGCRALLADLSEFANEEANVERIGVASLGTLRDAAMQLNIRMIACESGLRIEGISAGLAQGIEIAGIVSFLSAMKGGQVITL
eukprot:gene9667-9731_t